MIDNLAGDARFVRGPSTIAGQRAAALLWPAPGTCEMGRCATQRITQSDLPSDSRAPTTFDG